MPTTRIVAIDDPIAAPLAKKVSPSAKASTVAIVVEESGTWSELLALQTLDWDTRILGLRTGRITEVVARDATRASTYPELASRFESSKLEYVTVRRPIQEWDRLRAFEASGFRMVDGILSFTKDVSPSSMAANVRLATANDEKAVVAIAVATFKRSRFHNDAAISLAAADKLHEEWARNSCRGEAAKAVLVIEDAGRVGGFITCKFGADRTTGVIDLVGVAPESFGKGFGRTLVEASCDWFARNGCARVLVQTQIDNYAAIRLYGATKFVPDATFMTLRWSSREKAAK